MPFMMIHHKVKDFDRWYEVYLEHGDARELAGSRGGAVYQTADDPNDVYVLLEWDDLKSARKFADSRNLKEVMQRAGVIGVPEVAFFSRGHESEV